MTAKSIEVSSRAFTKLQLHLAKYPHCSVNGLLLACKKRLQTEKVLEVVDVVPLFHQCIQLSPMLEIALTNVDSHCDINQLCIAGYYEAPDYLKAPPDASMYSIRVSDKIHSHCPDAKLVIVDNTKVPTTHSLVFHEKSADGKWSKVKSSIKYDDECSEVLLPLLDRCVYRDLVDFDNHLDDISQHWLNHPINKLIVMH